MHRESSFFEDSTWAERLAAAEHTVFSLGEQQAREAERTLNRHVVDGQPVDDELITRTIAELDASCGHTGMQGIVSGTAYRRSLIYGEVDASGQRTIIGAQEDHVILERTSLVSHGYINQFNPADTERPYRLYHLMYDALTPIAHESVDFAECHYEQHFYRLPIDGEIDVQLPKPPKPSAELLRFYAPSSVAAIDHTLAQLPDDTPVEEILGAALRQLNTVELLQDPIVREDTDYSAALGEYIDQAIGINKTGLHVVSHDGPALICDGEDDYIGSVFLKKTHPLHGIVTGAHFIRVDDAAAPARLYLGLHVPTDTGIWHTLLIPPTDNLSIYPCNQLPLTPILHNTAES